jgi:hypothetical protein
MSKPSRAARIARFQKWAKSIPEPGSSISAQDTPDVRPRPRGFRAWAEQLPAVELESSVLAWLGNSGPVPDDE